MKYKFIKFSPCLLFETHFVWKFFLFVIVAVFYLQNTEALLDIVASFKI